MGNAQVITAFYHMARQQVLRLTALCGRFKHLFYNGAVASNNGESICFSAQNTL